MCIRDGLHLNVRVTADPGERAVKLVGLRSLNYLDRGLDSAEGIDVRLLCVVQVAVSVAS